MDFGRPDRVARRGRDVGFRFGLEAEFLLAAADTFRPLWCGDLDFAALDAALEAIPVGDLPPCDGLGLVKPHRTRRPFYVEGYHVPDPDAPDPTLVPKGIEIRTPVCDSVEAAVALLGELHGRLQRGLAGLGLRAAALAFHPTADRFQGPQGSRTFERWQWTQEVMRSYGPDVNIALPPRLAGRLDPADLDAKVNWYAPALVAPSLGAPLERGGPWHIAGRVGKSVRTYRRSPFGLALKRHPQQAGRLEFKAFEMSHRLGDFHAFLLLWLAVLLDGGLRGRAGDRERIAALRAVAIDGLAVVPVRERAAEVLDRAPATLASWGFDPGPLAPFARRLATGRLPADEILARFDREQSIPGVLRHLADLVPAAPIPTPAR